MNNNLFEKLGDNFPEFFQNKLEHSLACKRMKLEYEFVNLK